MKRLVKLCSILCIIIALCTVFTSCNKSLRTKQPYYQYYYNTVAGRFMKNENAITFGEDKTFAITYGKNTATMFGSYALFEDARYITLAYDLTSNESFLDDLQKELLEQGDYSYSDVLSLINQLAVVQSFYYEGDYLYSVASIQAYKLIEPGTAAVASLDSVEGVYVVQDYDILMQLKAGYIYMQDAEVPVDGEFPVLKGTYIAEKNYITLQMRDVDNNIVSTAKFFLGKITIPMDLAEEEPAGDAAETGTDAEDTYEWDDNVLEYLQTVQGKEIVCFTNSFYTTKDLK